MHTKHFNLRDIRFAGIIFFVLMHLYNSPPPLHFLAQVVGAQYGELEGRIILTANILSGSGANNDTLLS